MLCSHLYLEAARFSSRLQSKGQHKDDTVIPFRLEHVSILNRLSKLLRFKLVFVSEKVPEAAGAIPIRKDIQFEAGKTDLHSMEIDEAVVKVEIVLMLRRKHKGFFGLCAQKVALPLRRR